jgi:hypothetical protein
MLYPIDPQPYGSGMSVECQVRIFAIPDFRSLISRLVQYLFKLTIRVRTATSADASGGVEALA